MILSSISGSVCIARVHVDGIVRGWNLSICRLNLFIGILDKSCRA
jgi:hypothetical protein